MSDFGRVFRDSIRQLQEQVESLSSPELSLAQRKAATDALLAASAKVSAQLADESNNLAAYDLRSYNQSLKEIQDRLAATQASFAPKPKFSFKNKRLATPQSEVSSAATSRSVTPIHLEDTSGSKADQPVPVFAQPARHVDEEEAALHPAEQPAPPAPGVTVTSTHISIHGTSNSYLDTAHLDRAARSKGMSCVISDTSSTVVHLASPQPPPLLTINSVRNSLILANRIDGPAHITGLESSILVLSCRQFRMHKSHNVDVYLFCSSRPIIEDCSNIRFTKIPSTFNKDSEPTSNLFDKVDDFKWLRAEPSPNWRIMPSDQQITDDTWTQMSQDLAKLDSSTSEVAEQVRHFLTTAGIEVPAHHP